MPLPASNAGAAPRWKPILAYRVRSNGYVFQVEMAYLAQRLGFRSLEIPIYFKDGRAGHSKMSNAIKLEAAWRTWQPRWRYRHVRPLAGAAAAGDIAVAARRRMVLTGDAGSGKTTFVNRLAYLLATYSAVLPEALAGALPVRLLLREAAARRDLRRAGRTGAGDVRPDARPFARADRKGPGRPQHEGQPGGLDRR